MLPIVDADGHLDELPDEIMSYLDPPLRDQAMISRTHGLFPSWLAMEHRSQRFLAGHQYAGYRLDPTPDKWIAFADRAGIKQTVLYPTAALSFGLCGDPDVATYLARAYNNWAHARYTRYNQRLQCVALLPLQSVTEAVTELRRVHTERACAPRCCRPPSCRCRWATRRTGPCTRRRSGWARCSASTAATCSAAATS